MKPLTYQFLLLSLYLMMLSLVGKAQSIDQVIATGEKGKPFELSTYLGANRTVNLMLVVNQVKGVTLRIKDENDTTLHELHMKRAPKAYHFKLNFNDSKSGVYKLEISDGRKTLIRQIDVVDLPATEAQRYITFSSPFNQ